MFGANIFSIERNKQALETAKKALAFDLSNKTILFISFQSKYLDPRSEAQSPNLLRKALNGIEQAILTFDLVQERCQPILQSALYS